MLSPPPQPTLGEVGGAAGRIPCRPPPSAARGHRGRRRVTAN